MPTVAPIVPNAQENRGPGLFLEALRGGLSFMSQMAQQRRQSESDVARLAFAERRAEEDHALDQKKMAMAVEMQPLQQKLLEEQANLVSEQAAAYADGTATASQIRTEATRQKHLLLKEVSDNARAMKLDDPHFQTKNPMEFAKNVLEFGRMYHLSPLPEVKQQIKAYMAIADEQKLFIKHGVEEDATDDQGMPTKKIKPMGQGKRVSAWRFIANLNNPAVRDQSLRDLEASGYTEIVQEFKQLTDSDGKKVSVPNKVTRLREPVRSMLAENIELEKGGTPKPAWAEHTVSGDPLGVHTERDTDGTVNTYSPPAAAPTPQPDYGPDTDTPQYPIGTRGKRGGQWFVLTEQGWKPE